MPLSLKFAHGIFEGKNMKFAGVLRFWMPELSLANPLRKSALKSQSVTNSQRSLQHELHENLTTSVVGPERPVETQIAASIATTDACG